MTEHDRWRYKVTEGEKNTFLSEREKRDGGMITAMSSKLEFREKRMTKIERDSKET